MKTRHFLTLALTSLLLAGVSVRAATLIEATLSNAGGGGLYQADYTPDQAINAGDTSVTWSTGNVDDGYVYDPNDPTTNPPEQSDTFNSESFFFADNADDDNYWFVDIDITNELRFLDVWGRDDYNGNEQSRHQDLIITLYDGVGATGTALFTSSAWDGVSAKDDTPASYGRFDFVNAGASTEALTTAKSIRIDHSDGNNDYLLLAEVRAAQIPDPWSPATCGPIDAGQGPFHISEQEVTVAAYTLFLNAAETSGTLTVAEGVVSDANGTVSYCATSTHRPDSPLSYDPTADLGNRFSSVLGKAFHPMVFVSWFGAAAFCNWQSVEDGLTPVYDPANGWTATLTDYGYRLPTEQEWYTAAAWDPATQSFRAYGTGTDEISDSQVNFLNSGDEAEGEPVQTLPAYLSTLNPYGLCHASGNVWEWCHGLYDENDTDPTVDAHAVRGGSWGSLKRDVRTDSRSGFKPGMTLNTVGFRVVAPAVPAE